MSQTGRAAANKRFSLTDLADDDDSPIVRTDLMSPTLVPSVPASPQEPAADKPMESPVPVEAVEEIVQPQMAVAESTPAPPPAPAAPSAPVRTQTRVARQSREVSSALDQGTGEVVASREDFYANFNERKTKKQISLRIHPDVDKALTKEVLTKNLEGKIVTREAIITKAICNFLGIPYPTDM
nr:putative membrane protein [uncultured bacterium]